MLLDRAQFSECNVVVLLVNGWSQSHKDYKVLEEVESAVEFKENKEVMIKQ
jgi:hypothetical protein